jgi:hypothetical protein
MKNAEILTDVSFPCKRESRIIKGSGRIYATIMFDKSNRYNHGNDTAPIVSLSEI